MRTTRGTISRSTGWARRAAVVVMASTAALGGAAAVGAQPAQAVSSLTSVVLTSANNSTSPKTITASCPSGRQVYGIGYATFFGNGLVTMDDVRPNAALTSVTFTAYENGATSLNWQLYGSLRCGPANGLRVVTANSSSNSTSPKTALATCPSSTRLYGLGGEITGGVGNVVFDDMVPNSTLTSASVVAYEDADLTVTSNWSISAYAICGPAAATMVRVVETSTSDSTTSKASAPDDCPAGTRIHGAGAAISGATGQAVLTGNTITPPILAGDAGHATANASENGAFSGSWSVTSYEICAS